METLTAEGRELVEQAAQRHAVSADAILALLRALDRGGGTQAQFSHPDLGGMGQWSRGGMIMVGDMFNNGLKARVDQLCNELSDGLRAHTIFTPASRGNQVGGGPSWWPPECGTPSSSGSQNDMSYACFPDTRRVALKRSGAVTVYDTGEHRISGVSQQQGGGQDLTFTSQYGSVRLHQLRQVSGSGPIEQSAASSPSREPPQSVASPQAAASSSQKVVSSGDDDILAKIERLHALQQKGILSEAEYAEKKKELLARI
jgi:hypothetical protein